MSGNPLKNAKPKKDDPVRSLVLLTRAALYVSIILVIYIVIVLFDGEDQSVSLNVDSNLSANNVVPEKMSIPQAKPFAEYAQVIEQRDIFHTDYTQAGARSSQTQYEQAQKTAKADSELASKFKLVGIVLDDHPRAIVEDVGNNATLFLSLGDQMGDAQLEEILEGRVIFMHKGERVELVP